MTSSQAQPIASAEVLRELKIMSEDAFQRLGEGLALLQLKELVHLLAETRAAGPERAAKLAELYPAMRADSLLAEADPHRALDDAWSWFEAMEGLLEHYLGEQPAPAGSPGSTEPIPEPAGLSAAARPLYELGLRLVRHRDLIAGLSPQNLADQLARLSENAERLRELNAALQPADRLFKALQAYQQDVDGEWERIRAVVSTGNSP